MKKRVQCDILHVSRWLFFSIEKTVNSLGKNIKGKECGKGIFQRKGGWFIARFVDKRRTHHTYATRAIESGMQPKVLQKLLGHASIQTTIDRYVHVTDDSMLKAVSLFEESSPTATV